MSRFSPLVFALLAGCAVTAGPARFDFARFLATEPATLRQVVILPHGLGSTGANALAVEISTTAPGLATEETFSLVQISASNDAAAQRTVTTFALARADYSRFGSLQDRLRELNAAGAEAQLDLEFAFATCDEAGVRLRGTPIQMILRGPPSGEVILVEERPRAVAADLKARSPYCV